MPLLQNVIYNTLTLSLGDLMQLQAELDILFDRHMWPKGIVLEHQPHATLFWWYINAVINRHDLLTIDEDLTFG